MSNREILAVRDRTQVQNQTEDTGTWTKLAQDAWSVGSSLTREVRLLGQGVVGGLLAKGYDAFANNGKQTTVHLAESVAIGGALTIAARSGPAPVRLLAAGVGGYFGYQMSDWLKKDVFNGDRWSQIGSAISDTWKSGANMDRNITSMQNSAGTILFDSALMFGGGYAGSKLGAAGATRLQNFEVFFSRRGQNVASELTGISALEATGRFKADLKRVDANDPLVKLDEVIASKKKRPSTHDPRDIAGLLQESKMLDLANRDRLAKDLRDVKAPELQRENMEIQRTTDKLNADIKTKQKELTAVDTLSAEKKSVQAAESRLQSLESVALELGGKKAELRILEEQIAAQAKTREEAKKQPASESTGIKKAQETKAAEAEIAQYEALRETARELRRDISEKQTATDKNNPDSAINQAAAQLLKARTNLAEAEVNRPAKMAQIQAEIESLRSGVAENSARQKDVALRAQQVVESYYARLSELVKDPGALQPVKTIEPSKGNSNKNGGNTDSLNAETAKLLQPEGAVSVVHSEPVVKVQSQFDATPKAEPIAKTAGPSDASRLTSDQAANALRKPVADNAAGLRTKAEAMPEVKPEVKNEAKADSKSEIKTEPKAEAKRAEATDLAAALSTPEVKARLDAEARAKSAFDNAKPAVTEAAERLKLFDQARETKRRVRQQLDLIKGELEAIDSGKRQFADQAGKQQKIDELSARQKELQAENDKVQDSVKRVGSGHYFQAMRGIRRYSAAVEEYFAKEPDAVRRNEFAKEAVRNLESMLDELPKSRQGTRPPVDNLGRRGFTGKDVERVTEIREHADRRLDQMNHKNDGRNQSLLELKPVKKAFEKVTSGELQEALPEFIKKQLDVSQERIVVRSKPAGVSDRDWKVIQSRVQAADTAKMASDPAHVEAVMKNSSVVFFDQNGNLIGQVGTDGRFRPKYFDVPNILKGPGRGGAGIDRLQGESIGGYALIGPQVRLTFGGRFDLQKIGTNSKNEPIYSKEVMELEGKIPAGVEVGTPANRLSPAPSRPQADTAGDGKSKNVVRKMEDAG